MNRPDNISVYDELDLKLGIKSSLPRVKSTIALAILLWECADRPAELVYSQKNNDGIVMTDNLDQWVVDCLSEICEEDEINAESLVSAINKNQLFKSQMEALIVAFELVWKLAKVSFVDESKAASAERTGGTRYPKKLLYTVNADIIHSIIESNHDAYMRVLMAWVGFNINIDPECESQLMYLLTALSEGAVFKLIDGDKDVIFNQNSLYHKALETQDIVDVNGDKEAKGSLRILKSLLTDGMNPYLSYSNGSVSAMEQRAGDLEAYQKRVDTFLCLSATKVIGLEDMDESEEHDDIKEKLLPLENQKFAFACIDLMKEHSLLTENNLKLLADKEMCAFTLKHNNFHGIFFELDSDTDENEQKDGQDGRPRYYAENYDIDGVKYAVSSQWRPVTDTDDSRTPFVNWIIDQLKKIKFETGYTSKFARNRILFGAPGTGKSYTLNKERKELLGSDEEVNYERVTFHPDYSYANFVGTYKPIPTIDSEGKDAITYEYVPGPFMRVYVNALKSGRTDNVKPFLLIIEEINRANVAAVFGDVFQLLDRGENNVSEYPIQTSEDIKKYLATELGGDPNEYSKIRIPDNMFIWSTMNSADQGVFPMDTAFKRRWDFTYLGIDDNDDDIQGKYVFLADNKSQKVEWNKLRKAINNFLAKEKINEDKQLGPYFISRDIIVPKDGDEIDRDRFVSTFKNKVIMYLFEDAAKQKRLRLFEGCFQNGSRYSEICKEFETKGVGIFNHDIQVECEVEDIKPAADSTTE
ncbi:MAG: AAA family ATPase [Lachnospiraceae bacterium]|nr:AAA family ATPase [Lachnospiraceae bacterium]